MIQIRRLGRAGFGPPLDFQREPGGGWVGLKPVSSQPEHPPSAGTRPSASWPAAPSLSRMVCSPISIVTCAKPGRLSSQTSHPPFLWKSSLHISRSPHHRPGPESHRAFSFLLVERSGRPASKPFQVRHLITRSGRGCYNWRTTKRSRPARGFEKTDVQTRYIDSAFSPRCYRALL